MGHFNKDNAYYIKTRNEWKTEHWRNEGAPGARGADAYIAAGRPVGAHTYHRQHYIYKDYYDKYGNKLGTDTVLVPGSGFYNFIDGYYDTSTADDSADYNPLIEQIKLEEQGLQRKYQEAEQAVQNQMRQAYGLK